MDRALISTIAAVSTAVGAVAALLWTSNRAYNSAERQLDALLDRVSSAPNVVLTPAPQKTSATAPITPRKSYISDEPYMDTDWNNFLVPDKEEIE